MKNKKAMDLLGEHTVNLIIAVLSIVVLILLGTAVYNLFLGNSQDLEKAKATLNEVLVPALENLNKDGDSQTVIVYNPVGWGITFQDSIEKRPASCKGEKCLCICKYSSDVTTLFDNCNNEKTGVCFIDNRDMSIIGFKTTLSGEADILEISNLMAINMSLSKGTINIREMK